MYRLARDMEEADLTILRAYVEDAARSGAAQLPAEPRLSETLDISRGRLRTLLKRLEGEGLIWRHVGKGTFVGPRHIDLASPQWSEGISIGDIMDARLLLEPQLAAQAAIKAHPADLQKLDRCLAEMHEAPSFLHWRRLDERLHRYIAEAAHNHLLLLIYETLRSQGRAHLDRRLEDKFGHHKGSSDTDRQHKLIVDAIRNGDPDHAETSMREHLRSVRATLFGLR